MSIINKEAECDNCEPEHKHHSSSKLIFKVEKSMIKTAFYNLIFLILIETIAYFGFFKNIPDFFSKYGYYLIFLVIAVVINSIAIWHIKAYRHVFSCTTGMMIGMTIGMSSGFSIGLIVVATNGMFIGSLAGIIIGLIIMIYQEEISKKPDVHYHGFELLPFITVNFIITLGLTFLMVFGPRSFLFG